MKEKEYTFDMVWQMFAELGEQIKQNDKVLTEKFAETDKMIQSLSANNGAAEKELQEMRLQQKETDRLQKENERILSEKFAKIDKQQSETDKMTQFLSANIDKNAAAIKETNQAIGGLSKSNGYMAEEVIFNALERDMSFAGIKFDDIDRAKKRKIKKLNLEDDYDVMLKNGDTFALIEIKHRVREGTAYKLATEKLNNFRKLYSEYEKYEIVLCIGGMSFESNAIEKAKANGVGVIKIVGEKVEYNTDGITTNKFI